MFYKNMVCVKFKCISLYYQKKVIIALVTQKTSHNACMHYKAHLSYSNQMAKFSEKTLNSRALMELMTLSNSFQIFEQFL